jgi:hypothetical protein
MTRPLISLLMLAASAAFLPAPAQAQGGQNLCRSRGACAPWRDALALFGLPAAETRAAAGEEIRRALFIGASGNPIVAVEYRRAPGHEPTVSIYGDRETRAAGDDAIVSAAVPLAEWERLGEAARFFDRALAARAPGGEVEPLTVCADGETLLVETADPAALSPGDRLRRSFGPGCPADLASVYADALAEAALHLLPACAALEPLGPGNAPPLLRDCATLAGDRMAAAEVHNRLGALRWAQAPDGIAGLFAIDVMFEWNGERIAPREAAAAWLRHAQQDGRFYPRRLFGETGRRVRVEGAVTRVDHAADGSEIHAEAPVTLIFVNPPSQAWQIAELHAGAFAPVRWPRYPRPGASYR